MLSKRRTGRRRLDAGSREAVFGQAVIRFASIDHRAFLLCEEAHHARPPAAWVDWREESHL